MTDETREAVAREPGWYWIEYPGLGNHYVAYCHGLSWNGLMGAIEEKHIKSVSPRILPPDEAAQRAPLSEEDAKRLAEIRQRAEQEAMALWGEPQAFGWRDIGFLLRLLDTTPTKGGDAS